MKLRSLSFCLLFVFMIYPSLLFSQGFGEPASTVYTQIENDMLSIESQIMTMLESGKLEKDSDDAKTIVSLLNEIQDILNGGDSSMLEDKVASLQNVLDNANNGEASSVETAADNKTSSTTSGTTLPKYYVVKKREPLTDCLWRIAGYSFIYADSSKWNTIYEANKSIIKNADYIYPGQVLEIPSIDGQVREGTYNEDVLK